jgi:hypothetical protein
MSLRKLRDGSQVAWGTSFKCRSDALGNERNEDKRLLGREEFFVLPALLWSHFVKSLFDHPSV